MEQVNPLQHQVVRNVYNQQILLQEHTLLQEKINVLQHEMDTIQQVLEHVNRQSVQHEVTVLDEK